MCFTITKSTEELTEQLRDSKEKIIAYKVVQRTGPEGHYKYNSIFKGYQWVKGLNRSSRDHTSITEEERYCGDINAGFHFYRSLDYAKEVCSKSIHNIRAIQCEIDPKEVVAVNESEIVATEVLFASVMRKRKPRLTLTALDNRKKARVWKT